MAQAEPAGRFLKKRKGAPNLTALIITHAGFFLTVGVEKMLKFIFYAFGGEN